MTDRSDRLLFIDLIRGFAVILMVIGHGVDSVLNPEARISGWFQAYDFVRGFTAPIFLFVSGLVFSVATEKRWDAYTSYSPELRKRLLRIGLLLVVGYALHMPFFSLERVLNATTREETAALFQADVLHCVAGSLIILHGLILLLRTRNHYAMALMILVPLVAILTPLVSLEDFSTSLSPALTPYVNRQQLSLFPLFPFAGFLFAGALVGHFFLKAREQNMDKKFMVHLGFMGAVCAALAVGADLLPWSVFPTHDFWKSSPVFFLVRLAVTVEIIVLFRLLSGIPELLREHLTLLGQSSLLVYTTHIMIAYGSTVNPGLAQIVGHSLPGTLALLTALLLLGAMVMLVRTWTLARTRHYHFSQCLQAGLGGTLLYMFLISPY
jgi:uncharacterized membrane protein